MPHQSCSKYTCGETPSGSGRSFHSFPKETVNKARFDKFVIFCDRPPQPKFQQVGDVKKISGYVAWKPTNSSRICSDHFKETAFKSLNSGIRQLNDDAIPTEVGNKLRDDWRVTKPELMRDLEVNNQLIFVLSIEVCYFCVYPANPLRTANPPRTHLSPLECFHPRWCEQPLILENDLLREFLRVRSIGLNTQPQFFSLLWC